MSHPSTWAPLTWADLARLADQLAVIDATDGVTKTMIIDELLKRTLGSDTIAWMDVLGIGSVVPANDYLPIWSAVDSKFAALNYAALQKRMLSSTDVVSWMAAFANIGDIADDDIFFAFDTTASQIKRIPAGDLLRYIRIANTHRTADYSLAASVGYGRQTNYGAAATITSTLDAMPVGWRMRFLRHEPFEHRIDPHATQTIGKAAAGKYLTITGLGEVELEVIATNVIAVTGGSAPYSFEV